MDTAIEPSVRTETADQIQILIGDLCGVRPMHPVQEPSAS